MNNKELERHCPSCGKRMKVVFAILECEDCMTLLKVIPSAMEQLPLQISVNSYEKKTVKA
jgi:hypothetical protein